MALQQDMAGLVYNKTTVKPVLWECYKSNSSGWVASKGVFLGDNPLDFSMPLAMVDIIFFLGMARLTHFFLRPLGQSQTVSNIIAGIIMGPSGLGRIKNYTLTLFPARGTFLLDTLSLMNVLAFLFLISVKTDLNLLKKPGKMAMAMALMGCVPPLLICFCITLTMQSYFPPEMRQTKILMLLALRLCMPSFPVLADILGELQVLNSELGRLAMSTALISDVANWIISGIFIAGFAASEAKSILNAVLVVVTLIGFFLLVLFVARPIVKWMIKKTPSGETIDEGFFVGIMIMCYASASITEIIGYHATFGPVILGLAIPGGMPIGVSLSDRLDAILSGVFVPLYMSLAGFRTDFSKLATAGTWGYLELLIVVCYVGKLVGTMLVYLHRKKSLREAFSLGLMMNLKGVVEIAFLNNWGDSMMANSQHFSVMVMSLMLITATSTPLIKYLYKPTVGYVALKRRTIQHSKLNHEFRVLACVHNEDTVAAIIDLLEASHATCESPLSIVSLHLTELAGRAAPVLAPYKRNKKSSNTSTTDRIVNAFCYFERQIPGAVMVQPYVAISPGSTMHNDVCQLAFEKKVRLVILPFHKLSDGALATANPTFQTLNCNVLDYAPCSVAILVDRGTASGATCTHTNNLLNRVAVYFVGGADDRESLAYAMRMAGHPHIKLTVVRFLPMEHEPLMEETISKETKMDNEIIGELRARNLENVLFREQLVKDGEGTVAVIRSMSDKFDLLIVGRRKGQDSALTAGLSAWSECPELGLVGDMLAATDFGGKVSILVVQQHKLNKSNGAQEQQKSQLPTGIIANILNGNSGRGVDNQEEARDVLIHRRD